MKHWLMVPLMAVGTAIAGCSTGFSDTLEADGLYSGTLTVNTDPVTTDVLFAAVAQTGEMTIYNQTQNRLSVALSPYTQVVGDNFSANLRHYQASDTATPVTTGSLSGSGSSQGGLSGTILGGDRPGTFSLNYEAALYETSSSLPTVAGSYTNTSSAGTINLTVSTTGVISGSLTFSSGSCTYSGQISALDLTRNLYHVDSYTQSCTFTPSGSTTPTTLSVTYAGLALLRPAVSAADHVVLEFAMGNATTGGVIRYTKS